MKWIFWIRAENGGAKDSEWDKAKDGKKGA